MSRGRVVLGGVALVAALALSAPAAFAADGSVTDQGYPCATVPPPAPGGGTTGGTTGSGQCQTPTPTPAQPAPQAAASGVAGVSKTLTKSAPVKAAAPAPAAAVAPAVASRGTLPFTGLQLEIFVLIGVALIGGGLLLRHSSREKTDA